MQRSAGIEKRRTANHKHLLPHELRNMQVGIVLAAESYHHVYIPLRAQVDRVVDGIDTHVNVLMLFTKLSQPRYQPVHRECRSDTDSQDALRTFRLEPPDGLVHLIQRVAHYCR